MGVTTKRILEAMLSVLKLSLLAGVYSTRRIWLQWYSFSVSSKIYLELLWHWLLILIGITSNECYFLNSQLFEKVYVLARGLK